MPGFIRNWLKNSLIALDQFANAFLLFGYPDETISSRAGRNRQNCAVCNMLCRVLDRIDTRHCANAVQSELTQDYLPPELRGKSKDKGAE